jgi:uncharacterized RDD family membrane protein YckC
MQAQDSMASQPAVSADTVSADFFVRLVAALIDGVILVIPQLFIRMLLGPAIGTLAGLAIGVGYSYYFWTTSGQTPGKMAMSLKVVSAETGGLLEPSAALLRYVGYLVSSIPIGLGYLWVLWDPKHDAWHDKIAKTKVIRVAK